MANKKADNQWYGKGFEQDIEGVFNNKNDLSLEKIPNEKAKILIKQAQSFINQYNVLIEPMTSCIWTGQHTKNASGDLIINGHSDEIKHVESGQGTYLGTSWDIMRTRYNLDYFNVFNYLSDNGFYDKLIEYLGENKVNMNNISPVSTTLASKIIKDKDFFTPYKKHDEECRKKLNSLFCNSLKNIELRKTFLMDCVTKNISNKHMPDNYIVYNYKKDKITNIYTKKQLLEMTQNLDFTPTELGGTIGFFRFQVGWQNGAALCNPTVRIYIK